MTGMLVSKWNHPQMAGRVLPGQGNSNRLFSDSLVNYLNLAEIWPDIVFMNLLSEYFK